MKTIKINESQLHTIIKESVKKVLREMDELSPALLQRAADKAFDQNRWSQHDAFEDEAGKRAQAEFAEDSTIRIITPKKISYISPEGAFCVINREGAYSYRLKNGFNNETGNLRGGNGFPNHMKVQDKRTARTIVKWWNTYNMVENPIPFMEDWHNLLAW